MKCTEWIKRHTKPLVIAAAIVAFVAVALGLSLGLTLPVKSVEVEGELFVLRGESYTGGLTIKQTTRAGLVHREDVLGDMIEGFDSSVVGEQEILVNYRDWQVKKTVTVIDPAEIELRVREGTLPKAYSPNAPFATTGIFDLYYEGEILRSAPIVPASAPDFSTVELGYFPITLCYGEGIECDYAYSVTLSGNFVEIESIEAEGILLLPQGKTVSKSNVIGDVRFHVIYADGTETYVRIGDSAVGMQESVFASDSDGNDYETTVTFYYNGHPFDVSATAFYGDLFAPETVQLTSERAIYAQGDTFDYSSATLLVVFERFGGAPVSIRATQEMVFLAEWQGTPDGKDGRWEPVTDGSAPIVFDEVGEYTLIAYYNLEYSAPLTIHVISKEEAARVTGIETTWNGGASGPPKKGADLDYAEATLRVEYGSGYHYKTLLLKDAVAKGSVVVSGYDKEKAGNQTLTITYQETGQDPVFIKKNVRVTDAESDAVTGIIGVAGWDKTFFTADELVVPETASLVVEIAYGGQDDKKIKIKGNEAVTITGFKPRVLGTQELTIAYAGFTVTHRLSVWNDADKEIQEFYAPKEIYVEVGGEIDLKSAYCKIVYSTGDFDMISLEDLYALAEEKGFTGVMEGTYDNSVAGESYSVKFHHPDFGWTDDWTQIRVVGDVPVVPIGIRLDAENAKTVYRVGETISTDGMKLYLVYNDRTEEDITETDLAALVFRGFTTDKLGPRTATVFYVSGSGMFSPVAYDYTVVSG